MKRYLDDLQHLPPTAYDIDRPLPDPVDREITRLIESTPDGDLVAQVEGGHRRKLSLYAFRMASLAVRENDPTLLATGFVAALLAAHVGSPRYAVIEYALLGRSAERMGLDLIDLADAAASRVGGTVGKLLREWSRLPPEMRDIRRFPGFRYREADLPSGYIYERVDEHGRPIDRVQEEAKVDAMLQRYEEAQKRGRAGFDINGRRLKDRQP